MKFFNQLESNDCAAACVSMILSHFKKNVRLEDIKVHFELTRAGVSIEEIIEVTGKMGLESTALALNLAQLEEIPLPAILYWKQSHFVILEDIKVKKGNRQYLLADPSYGRSVLDSETFSKEWLGNNEKGICIISQLNSASGDLHLIPKRQNTFRKSKQVLEIVSFVTTHKKKYLIAAILLGIGLISSWLIPLCFQKVIDTVILPKNIHLLYYLLFAQIILIISTIASEFLSSLILTKINYILSIQLIKNLLLKLLKLPISFFDVRLNTEILQRLQDQSKIQTFVTWKGIELIFNLLNIIIFSTFLAYYNLIVFGVYILLTSLSILWTFLFIKRREVLDYAMFLRKSEISNYTYEFVMNMPEIKINNAENSRIDKWVLIQNKIIGLELKSLFLNMYQLTGANFLSKIKEILVIAICAYFIIQNQLSLGALFGITYIMGQLSGPISNLVGFIKDAQEAYISNKRIELIYESKNENEGIQPRTFTKENINIRIDGLTFKYPGKHCHAVLKNISVNISANSVTAIVGASGSGKTTLMKLLLSYYNIDDGFIFLNEINLKEILPEEWRKDCGIVLQDGSIFSGTIAENISFSEDEFDLERLNKATCIANLKEFIDELPMGYYTKIGKSGMSMSGGQMQRLLIARAVYRNPKFIFLDEATSALDAENEKIIHDNLQEFFKGKTVIIIAHRLSTVKNADQIIVLDKGNLTEIGTHIELVEKKGYYYSLIKNQLELGA